MTGASTRHEHWDRGDRDLGAGSLEYLAAIAVCVLVLAAAGAAVVSGTSGVGNHVRAAVCELFSLGQGDCSGPAVDAHLPTQPCVVSASTESVSHDVAVIIVTAKDGSTYEVARLSDGRVRVTQMKGGAIGVEAGAGGGVIVTWDDKDFGGNVSADAGAEVTLRAGNVWYVSDPAEAERLIAEASENVKEDGILGSGAARGVWEFGQNVVGGITGNGDYDFPPPHEVIVEGGVVLNASANATATPQGTVSGSLGITEALGTRINRDGTTTVYLNTKVSGSAQFQTLGLDPNDPSLDVIGAKGGGTIDVLTAVKLDNQGNPIEVTATVMAAGESAGAVASLFNDDQSLSVSDNQVNKASVYQATLPLRTAQDKAVAGRFLLAAGVTQLGGTNFAGPGGTIGAVGDFINAAGDRGTMTQQQYDTNSSSYGAQAEGKVGIELGGGASYSTSSKQTTDATYWDGTRWAQWDACQ